MNSRNHFSNRFGSTTVELAFTLPIFFLLLFGFYELSRINLIVHTAEAAAYEGARVGILPGATNAEVVAATENVLDTIAIKNASVTVNPTNLQNLSDTVQVTVDLNFGDNSLLVPKFLTAGHNFTRQCQLIRELQEDD